MVQRFLTVTATASFAFAIMFVSFQSTVLGQIMYSVEEVEAPLGHEWRCFFGEKHFMSVTESSAGVVGFRVHPGEDENGWGVSQILNVMLSSGQPSRGAVVSVTATARDIVLTAMGDVDAGGGTSNGMWTVSLQFKFKASTKRISGTGGIDVWLDDTLKAADKDLVIGRMASNYLDDVPLQGTRVVGDTGDMLKANVSYALFGSPLDFSWVPPLQPGHYPQDESIYISIQNVGTLNNVDTFALGENFQIKIAKKPTLKWALISAHAPMIVGLDYDISKSQDFAADNVGMSCLVLRDDEQVRYHFDVRASAQPTSIPRRLGLLPVLR